MKIKFIYLLFLIQALILNVKCNTKDNPPVKSLIIPTNMGMFNFMDSVNKTWHLDSMKSSPFMIYTLVNAYCSCCVDEINKCNQLNNELRNIKNVTILPICYSHDNFDLLNYLFESKQLKNISLPLALDSTDMFRKNNAALIDKQGKLTVLTNSQNRILAIGDPYDNKDDKEAFLKILQQSEIAN